MRKLTAKQIDEGKKNITVAKFGGGVIGEHGQGIPLIVKRIRDLREIDGIGPVAVFSAPKGLTDRVIEMGKKCAKGNFPHEYKFLMGPYRRILDKYVKDSFKNRFENELEEHFEEVRKALERVYRNKEFEGGNRAIVLAYSGELSTATAMSYVLNSYGIAACYVPFSEWPIITDRNFESATFLLEESEKKVHHLVKRIEEGKVVAIGGFVGSTLSGRETTFERGGSDRTAVDLGILLKDSYNVTVDFEKESVVMSADPNIKGIDKSELSKIRSLSYNETRLAGQYGMSIIDSVAIRDIPPDLDLPLEVTDTSTGEKTMIRRYIEDGDSNPIKIVTGRKDCAILEVEQSKSGSLYDFLEGIKKYYEFTELRPYVKNDVRTARILFFDGNYVREDLISDLMRIDENATIEYGLAAVTLIGDRMAEASGVVATAYGGIRERHPDLVILDGDIQRPTSSVLMIVKEDDRDRCVRAIHEKRKEMNKK